MHCESCGAAIARASARAETVILAETAAQARITKAVIENRTSIRRPKRGCMVISSIRIYSSHCTAVGGESRETAPRAATLLFRVARRSADF
jgi:hypothetical protein